MSTRRVVVLMGLFAAIGAGLIVLRSGQVQASARMLAAEREWLNLRQDLWQTQASIARLKAPSNVHERARLFNSGTRPPPPLDPVEEPGRLASVAH